MSLSIMPQIRPHKLKFICSENPFLHKMFGYIFTQGPHILNNFVIFLSELPNLWLFFTTLTRSPHDFYCLAVIECPWGLQPTSISILCEVPSTPPPPTSESNA